MTNATTFESFQAYARALERRAWGNAEQGARAADAYTALALGLLGEGVPESSEPPFPVWKFSNEPSAEGER